MTTYQWVPATGLDVPSIVEMAQSHFENEIDAIFQPEPVTYSRNVTLAVVNQYYLPNSEFLKVVKDNNGKLMAYTWGSIEVAPWSDNRMVAIRMAHVDLELSVRDRIRLVQDMLEVWEDFAKQAQIPIICSTTMRKDQSGFLKLHQKHGYDVRGSYAYKKINLK